MATEIEAVEKRRKPCNAASDSRETFRSLLHYGDSRSGNVNW